MVVAPPLVDVTPTPFGIEYSIHECPRRNREDVQSVFPGIDLEGVLIIPTCQQADMELVQRGERVENEKDRLLERFMEFAKEVCKILSESGYWADYIDPCSGLPMIHRQSGNVYGEVEALCTLLGYSTQNAGCCKIVLHPRWGSAVYPASMFAKAPVEKIMDAIKAAEQSLAGTLS